MSLASQVTALATAVGAALKATRGNLTSHTSNTANPHSTTATQVGLGRVSNVKISSGATAPTNPTEGDIWIDTSSR